MRVLKVNTDLNLLICMIVCFWEGGGGGQVNSNPISAHLQEEKVTKFNTYVCVGTFHIRENQRPYLQERFRDGKRGSGI